MYIIEVNVIKIISKIGLADSLDLPLTNNQQMEDDSNESMLCLHNSWQSCRSATSCEHEYYVNWCEMMWKTRLNSTFLHRPVVIRFSLLFLSVYVPWTIIFNTWKIRLWLKAPDDNIITDTADDRPWVRTYGDVAEAEGEGLNWPWVTKVLTTPRVYPGWSCVTTSVQ